mgnify:FL=1
MSLVYNKDLAQEGQFSFWGIKVCELQAPHENINEPALRL